MAADAETAVLGPDGTGGKGDRRITDSEEETSGGWEEEAGLGSLVLREKGIDNFGGDVGKVEEEGHADRILGPAGAISEGRGLRPGEERLEGEDGDWREETLNDRDICDWVDETAGGDAGDPDPDRGTEPLVSDTDTGPGDEDFESWDEANPGGGLRAASLIEETFSGDWAADWSEFRLKSLGETT